MKILVVLSLLMSIPAFAQNFSAGDSNVRVLFINDKSSIAPEDNPRSYEALFRSLGWKLTFNTSPHSYRTLDLLNPAFQANIKRVQEAHFVIVGAQNRTSEGLTPTEAFWIGLAQSWGKPVLVVSPSVSGGFASMVADVNRYSGQPWAAEFPNVYEAVTAVYQTGVNTRYVPQQAAIHAPMDSMIPGFINGTGKAAWVNTSVSTTDTIINALKTNLLSTVSIPEPAFSENTPERTLKTMTAITHEAQFLLVDFAEARHSVFQAWLMGFTAGIRKPILSFTSDPNAQNTLSRKDWSLVAGIKYSIEKALSADPVRNFNVILRPSLNQVFDIVDLAARRSVSNDLSVAEDQLVRNRFSLTYYLRRVGNTETSQALQCRQMFLR